MIFQEPGDGQSKTMPCGPVLLQKLWERINLGDLAEVFIWPIFLPNYQDSVWKNRASPAYNMKTSKFYKRFRGSELTELTGII